MRGPEPTPQLLREMYNAEVGQGQPKMAAEPDDMEVDDQYGPKAPIAPQVLLLICLCLSQCPQQ